MTTRSSLLGQLRSLLFLSLLLLGSRWLAACASPAPSAAMNAAPVSGNFVGKVEETNAYIGLVSDGKKAIAYICDGTANGVKLLHWFKGPTNGNQADLLTETNDHLRAQLSADKATGTIQLSDGRNLSFTAQATSGAAGLYRADQTVGGDTVTFGWVLLSDGTQRGGKLRKKEADAEVPPLSPANLQVKLDDGTTLSAQRVTPEFIRVLGILHPDHQD